MASRTPEQLKRHRERQRIYVALNRDRVNSAQREYAARPEVRTKARDRRHKNLIKVLLTDVRKRARQKGLPFNLTEADVVIPAACPVLGIPIIPRGPRNNWPSLDRHIPALGYTVGNVYVISYRANRLKGDATFGEVERILQYMRGRSDETVDARRTAQSA